jgi:hypothetical protein
MLVACRLAGLSARGGHYADINARTQCECVRRLQVGLEERRRPRPPEGHARAHSLAPSVRSMIW